MRILLSCLSIVLLSACVGKPTRPSDFYILSVEPAAMAFEGVPGPGPSIGIGPVILPELLDRPQIVTRSSANEVRLAEYHRWGGELESELVRVLAQNLMSRLRTERMRFHPWPSSQSPDLQVSVRFFRFDGSPGTGVVLTGIWSILDGRRECELQVHNFQIEESTDGPGYGGLVAAMSRGVGRLSDGIAAAVLEVRPGC